MEGDNFEAKALMPLQKDQTLKPLGPRLTCQTQGGLHVRQGSSMEGRGGVRI